MTLIHLGAALAAAASLAAAAEADDNPFTTGPVIADYGPVAAVEGARAIPDGMVFRVAFDVAESAKPGAVNRRLETAARFLNMHAAAGVPAENLHVAVVVHGQAAKDLTRGTEDTPNANAGLIAALAAEGVDILVCGQSAAYHGVAAEDLAPGVEMALSAMTAHAELQQAGYTLNPF